MARTTPVGDPLNGTNRNVSLSSVVGCLAEYVSACWEASLGRRGRHLTGTPPTRMSRPRWDTLAGAVLADGVAEHYDAGADTCGVPGT